MEESGFVEAIFVSIPSKSGAGYGCAHPSPIGLRSGPGWRWRLAAVAAAAARGGFTLAQFQEIVASFISKSSVNVNVFANC